MKIGAVIATSIELIDQVLVSKQTTRFIINNHIKKNRFIGAKDKKLLYDLVFNTLKKYFSLIKVCKKNKVNVELRNLVLLNIFNQKIAHNLEEVYDGKYSITAKKEDKQILDIAFQLEKKILPTFPSWIEERLSVSTLKKINNIYKNILVEPKFDIAINILAYSREEIRNKLTNLNIRCKNTICSPYGITVEKRIPKNNLKKIKKDFFEVQDEGSQVMTMLTSITPGTKVLDFCAGKGTKTIFIKNTFLEKEDIYAYDKDLDRSNELKKRIKELNINNIKVLSKISDVEKKFDVVLCDVPCTGTGTWRRRPENIIRLKESQLNELVKVQASILNDASIYCKNGGEIVYISCSLLYEENEEQIKKFLNDNKNFKLIDIRKRWETNFTSKFDIEDKSWITLTPDVLETDGYFISILKKNLS